LRIIDGYGLLFIMGFKEEIPVDAHIGGQLLFQLLLICLNAVFAAAEIAVISMNDTRMAQLSAAGDKRAKRLEKLTSQPARFLATIQVAITLSGFLGSAFAAENFSDVLVKWLVGLGVGIPEKTLDAIAVVVITIVLSYFTLVFGELLPKRIAMKHSEKLALRLSGLVSLISKVFAPIVAVLTFSTNMLLRLIGINPEDEEEEVSEEEIRMMVDAGSEKGVIDPEEQAIINNVFEFDDLPASEFVTHRTEVSMLWAEESDEEWEKTIFESTHSLYPVCGETADHVIGILHARDYFRLKDRSRENVMKHAVKPAFFVPESIYANVLFRQMKKNRSRLAVVLDEYGGMLGIITINDLLEQIVGNFDEDQPAAGTEESEIEKLEENKWRIKGSCDMVTVAQETGTALPADEFETFGSFVFAEYGFIPEDGTKFEIRVNGIHVQVVEVCEHRLENAIVTKEETEEEE